MFICTNMYLFIHSVVYMCTHMYTFMYVLKGVATWMHLQSVFIDINLHIVLLFQPFFSQKSNNSATSLPQILLQLHSVLIVHRLTLCHLLQPHQQPVQLDVMVFDNVPVLYPLLPPTSTHTDLNTYM